MGKGPTLRIEAVSLAFGGLQVLDGVSFAAQPGELFALIGPNGAGKTSVLNCVCGIYRARTGRIELRQEQLLGPIYMRRGQGNIAEPETMNTEGLQ